MTLGADGGVLVDDDGDDELRAYDVPVVDTVGAGDAFCGVLAAALAGGAPLRTAAHRASAAGGLAVTRPGAEPSMPTTAEVDDLIATGRLREART